MLRRAGAIILFVLALLLVPPVAARQTNPISLLHSQATPDFPNQIVFSLGATSTAAAITEVQLLYGATRSDTLTVVDLDVPRDPIVKVGHTLDTQVFYFPPGTEMTYRWLIRDAAGNTLETEPLQFVYDDQRFAWSERSIGEVTVYWYEGGSTFGDTLAATVERALGDLSADLGAELSQPVRIYVYTSSADLYSALQANSEEWIGGQANPELGVILAAISPDSESEVRRIIPHEISHQVLHQVIANPYVGAPFWLDEGLAVHHQEVRDRDYDLRVADAAAQNQLIPLEALAANFPADPEQALLSYAESRDIVEYILETYGAERLQVLVAARSE
ncbi:MAG: hypothetical protein HGA65_19155, partial [Oscillochloris sp.]|nr:hypothetical protein [Oscillochloris sp.]